MLLYSSGHSSSAGAAVLWTCNLGVRLCLSPHTEHEERWKTSLQGKALCSGRSGVWDPQHGDSLAPLLLESWDLRCTLLMSCLCWVYVRLTDKAAWLFASQSSPVFCAPVCWGLDFISLGSDYTWERNIGKKMKHQILGSDFAKLGTGPEEEMTLIKVNPGNQHSGASNAFLVWFIDVVFTDS